MKKFLIPSIVSSVTVFLRNMLEHMINIQNQLLEMHRGVINKKLIKLKKPWELQWLAFMNAQEELRSLVPRLHTF